MTTHLDPHPSDDLVRGANPQPAVPLFCPLCARTRSGSSALCEECGERLQQQGYCGVCDEFWPRPAGSYCPKHEIPLEDATQLDALEAPAGPWTTVQTFSDTLSAEGPRVRLEAEGIPTFLEGERMGMRSMYHIAAGGVRLQVPESLVADARVILSQNWQPIDDDLDDAWEELAPEPGLNWRNFVYTVNVALVLVAPLVVGLIALTAFLVTWSL
ncbi:MAG: hypothetical protein U0794_06260 [Isosphaeraceae bacterium]